MIFKNTLKTLRSFFIGTLLFYSFNTKIQAQAGAALNFDGVNDYVNITSQSFGTNWSVEAWIKPTNVSSSTWNTVLGQSFWNNTQGFVIAIQSGSIFVASPGPNGVNISTPVAGGGIWTHVAVTYNNGIWALYKDGLLAGTQVQPFTNSANPFYLGAKTDNANSSLQVDYYQGDMDEVRIWNVTRTQCEIQEYLGCEIPTTATGLVANYHFNQGFGNGVNLSISSLTDNAGSNSGSLNNGLGTSTLPFTTTSNWLTLGSPASGNTSFTISNPEINITGNSVTIADGDISPSATDYTDFNGLPTRTFVIQSLGSSTLNVGVPVFTGANASEFSVTVAPSPTLAALSGSTYFVVAFTPTSVGTKSAVLNLYNSDCSSEDIYDFVISAATVTGSALNFAGSDNYIETGANIAELGQGDFTIEAWIKTMGGQQAILTCANTNTVWEAGEKCFYIDGIGRPAFVGWGNNYIFGNISVNDGLWHHVAVVWDYIPGTTGIGKMYIDGVDHTTALTYSGNHTNSGTFKIGRKNYGTEAPNNFNGSIDELRIWNRVLCLPEILNNMNCELPSPTSQLGLSGYYKFNSGVAFFTNTSVTTAIDAALPANNGTLMNFTLTGGPTSNWIYPGGVTSGSSCAVYLLPEINILGNATTINSGDATPSLTDYTDFGNILQGSSVVSRTFVIQNSGTAPLTISGYSLSGANATEFTITTNPAASIAAANSSTIVVSFSATTLGVKTASLTITNNDCDEGVYRFVINANSILPASALNFDGTSDRIIVPPGINLNNQSFTIEFWTNRTSTLSNYVIGQVSPTVGTNQSLHVGFRPGNIFTFAFYSNDLDYTTPATSDGNYHHWACVYNASAIGKNRFIYLDGVLVQSDYSNSALTSTGSIIIGDVGFYGSYPSPFIGTVDELRIWGTPRTQCEIQTYMNCEIPTTATGLIANYHFNQGFHSASNTTFTTLIDATGNHNGTLSSFALSGTTSNWVFPGGVVSNYTTAAPPTVSISVSGNANPIGNNSVATSTLNHTAFGTATTRTFVIQNSNTGTLNISAPFITGINANQFSVTVLPSLSLAASATTSFVVAFTPTSSGVKSATVNVLDNDCNNPLFAFTIEGTPPPASALSFDGTDDFIDLSSSNLPSGNNDYTVEFWVKLKSAQAGHRWIYSLGTAVAGSLVTIGYDGSNGNRIRIHHFGPDSLAKTASIPLNVWTHVAVNYKGSGLSNDIYINGNYIETINFATPLTIPSNPALQIGCFSSNLNYIPDMELDELRVWNVARNQCEILSYMNCEIPATATGLVANYHFNQGADGLNNTTINSLIDAAGANTGTLTNFSLLTGTVSNWIAPGAIVNGFTTAVVPTSSISITGNGNIISAGSTVPSLTNYTDFGTVNSRTFVIQSSGGGAMYIHTPVYISGVNASEFSITSQPSSSITTGSTNMVVAFTPTALGTRSAIVHVKSSDCTSPDYSFAITGTASPGAALHFDGVNDYASVPVFNTVTNNITLQAKVLFTGTTSPNQIIVYNGSTSTSGYGLYVNAASNQVFLLYGGVNFPSLNYSFTPNQWTYLTLVIQSNKISFYVNSVLTTTLNPVTVGVPNLPTGSFLIGSNDFGTENFSGAIDEVLLWNRALNQCEIQAYANCEIATSASSLIANYHFNQGIAAGLNLTTATLTDASGNNNHLNLTGFSLNGSTSNWVAQGAVTSGSSCSAYSEPEIDVTANTISIPDGNTVTAGADNTDFGNISTTSVTVKSYTIQNTGNAPLSISSISMSGVNASQYTVGALSPASPVSANSSAVFSITFAPTSSGTKTAVVNISNTDCDESSYDFVVSGSAINGSALSFDGTNDYVNCGNILTASYTKEAWVKIGASTNGNNFLSGGSGSSGHALWAPGLSPYNYKLSAGHDLNWSVVQDPNPLSFDVWYHVAVTYDALSKIMTLYKNGVAVSSNTILPYSGTNPLSIGGFGNNFTINGSMDEVRIWNRPLCQSEIQAYMNCEIQSTLPDLIANYHFNQGVGFGNNITTTLVTDASGNANTGTLVNFATTGTVSNWVGTSTVTTGTSCTLLSLPEINVVGNGVTINDGATTATISNHTDFGGVCINGQVVRTFTIQNTGSSVLSVSSITVGGVNASLSSVGPLIPASPIPAGSSAVFSVSFTPTSSGVKTTTLYITNNDCNETSYDFVMTGTCNPLPVVAAGTTNSLVCEGFSTTLNGSGADTYTWTGGTPSVTNGVSFTPTTTLTYTVVGTTALTGCTSTNLAVQTISVNPNPTITATPVNTVICNGNSITITPGGANSYTINPGNITGTSYTLTPSSNITYSVTGTSTNACVGTNTAIISVTVNPLPVVTATTSNPVICNTATTSLLGGGADTYTWSGGATNNVPFTPSVTNTYSVTGTNALTGCTSTNTAVQTITVNTTPTVSAASVSSVICEGNSATLTASGASNYTWQPGNVNTAVYNPTPGVYTTYTVVGTSSAGCTSTNTAVQSVSVNTRPTVTASISNSVICEGEFITLTGSGANTYTWTGGVNDGVPFVPLTTDNYTLIGMNAAGCTNTNLAVASVTVNTLPTLTVTATNSVICLGEQVTLDGSGASTYTWSGGITNNIAFTPSSTASYSLTGADANGCINTSEITITVNNLPVLTVTSSTNISCEAQTVTLTVSGASSYTWNTTETNNSIVVSPTTTSTYSIYAVDVNSCTNTVSYTQSVVPCPGTFTAYTTKMDISCTGKDDGLITVTSANSYTGSTLSYYWNPQALCPGNNCDTIKNLKAGTYSLTLVLTYTINGTLVKMDTLHLEPINLFDLNGQCAVKVFSGITLNNDGVNDVLTIENIEEFPDNTVTIFNRWGQQLYRVKGYNNLEKAWPLNNEGNNLSSGTYFYIIDLGNNKPIKGWIELIKN